MPATKIYAEICAGLQGQVSNVRLTPEPAIGMNWLRCLCMTDPMPGNLQAIAAFQDLPHVSRSCKVDRDVTLERCDVLHAGA